MCHEHRRIDELAKALHEDGDTIRVWFHMEGHPQDRWSCVGSVIIYGDVEDAHRRADLIFAYMKELHANGRPVSIADISAVAIAINEGDEALFVFPQGQEPLVASVN